MMSPAALLGARIYLVVHVVSFLLSCVLGPRRGHSFVVSAVGGLALGPLNLLLIFLLSPSPRPGRCPSCAAFLEAGATACGRCGKPLA
jgi:hypothetical protein